MDSDKKDKRTKLLYEKPHSREQAREIQKELRKKVRRQNGFKKLETIAGIDLGVMREEKKLICGVIVFSYPELEEIENVYIVAEESFPYVPGLLSFREGPAIVEALSKLSSQPDILMLDGHGIAHPRALGIASHIGVILDIPSIGVGKKKLYGHYNEPSNIPGKWEPLVDMRKLKTIGAVVKTKRGTKPVFVSVGHKVNLKSAIKIALKCVRGYRIPEPTRRAHNFVANVKKELKQQ